MYGYDVRTHHYAVVFQVACVVKLFHIVLMKAKLVTQIFASTITSEKLYFLVTMILYFTLKFFELFKCFRLVFHQVDTPIPTQIIYEGEKITISATNFNIQWTTYICMYDFQQICCSLHSTGERCFFSSYP